MKLVRHGLWTKPKRLQPRAQDIWRFDDIFKLWHYEAWRIPKSYFPVCMKQFGPVYGRCSATGTPDPSHLNDLWLPTTCFTFKHLLTYLLNVAIAREQRVRWSLSVCRIRHIYCVSSLYSQLLSMWYATRHPRVVARIQLANMKRGRRGWMRNFGIKGERHCRILSPLSDTE